MGNVQDLRKQGRKGGMRWKAEWRSPDGSRHSRVFASKDAAQAHVQDQESDQRRGVYVLPNKVTVGEMWPRWRQSKARLSRSTLEGYDAAWRTYVAGRWEHQPIHQIDRAMVLEWLPTLRTKAGKELSASWARKVAIVLRGILDLSVDAKLLAANPLGKIGKALPEQLPTERRYLSVVEVDALVAEAVKVGIGLEVRTLVMTGMRRGEMAGLRVGDLDVARKRLRISRDVDAHGDVDATKTRRHRDVPVGGTVLADLQRIARGKARDVWLLPSPGGEPWRRDTWRTPWDRATAAAGIAGLDTHELRHTAVSLAIHAGANVKTVQRMVGHRSAAITLDVYGHLWDDELDSMPGRIEAHMEAERKRAAEALAESPAPHTPHKRSSSVA